MSIRPFAGPSEKESGDESPHSKEVPVPHFTLRQEIEQLQRMGDDARRESKYAAAERFYTKAVRLADLLRQDRASVTRSSSHANATDAFAASSVTQALDQLAKLIGTPPPKAKGEPRSKVER